jgi:hypothetical protein
MQNLLGDAIRLSFQRIVDGSYGKLWLNSAKDGMVRRDTA